MAGMPRSKATMFSQKPRSPILDQVWNFLESNDQGRAVSNPPPFERTRDRRSLLTNRRAAAVARVFRASCDGRSVPVALATILSRAIYAESFQSRRLARSNRIHRSQIQRELDHRAAECAKASLDENAGQREMARYSLGAIRVECDAQ